MMRFILPAIAGLMGIAIVTIAIMNMKKAAYNSGFDSCAAQISESTKQAMTEKFKLEKAALELEVKIRGEQMDAKQKAVENLERINANLQDDKTKAVESLEITLAGITDDEWYCASEPVPHAVIDDIRMRETARDN